MTATVDPVPKQMARFVVMYGSSARGRPRRRSRLRRGLRHVEHTRPCGNRLAA